VTTFSLSTSLNNATAQVLEQFIVSQPQRQAPALFLVALSHALAHSTVSLENHENASWSQLPVIPRKHKILQDDCSLNYAPNMSLCLGFDELNDVRQNEAVNAAG